MVIRFALYLEIKLMPTIKQMVKQMMSIESQADDEPGAYPIIFKNDWEKIKFVLLLKWERLKRKCHL
jgi:hypothetical protein